MIDGLLTKSEYKELKSEYTVDETRLYDEIAEHENNLKDMEHREKQQLIEQIHRFENMTELD